MEISKKNILFLTARLPYPVIGGDRLKPYHILKHLGKTHNVVLISFYQGKSNPNEYAKELEKLNIEIHIIKLNPLKAGIIALSKLKRFPMEIAYYYSKEFQRKVDELCKIKSFDIGIAFFMRTAEYIKEYTFKKLLMAEDCRILYQKRSYEQSKNIKQKIVRYWEYKKLIDYEPHIVNFFDIVTLVTENDIEAMRINNPKANYRLLTNGTDIEHFKPSENGNPRNGILFFGKLDVWANILMVENIVKDIFPLVRKAIPEVKLYIIGSNPPKRILKLSSEEIHIIPNVPDVVPYLQSMALFLHPHSGGSGIQNKLIEAMSCGCPVVTTKTGIQGIPAKDNIHILIGNTSLELAEKTIRLLKDKEFARVIGENARNLIVSNLSWDSIYQTTDKIINELTSN